MAGIKVPPGTERDTQLVLWYDGFNESTGAPGDIHLARLDRLSEEQRAELTKPGRAYVDSAAYFVEYGLLAIGPDGTLVVADS